MGVPAMGQGGDVQECVAAHDRIVQRELARIEENEEEHALVPHRPLNGFDSSPPHRIVQGEAELGLGVVLLGVRPFNPVPL